MTGNHEQAGAALIECSCGDRLDALEEKIDACLVLLRMATTHDSFGYCLSDKSPAWTRAIRGAEVIVSRVIDRVGLIHREYERAIQTGGVLACPRPDPALDDHRP